MQRGLPMPPGRGRAQTRSLIGGMESRAQNGKLQASGSCDTTVDSGAEGSVWHVGWLEEEPARAAGSMRALRGCQWPADDGSKRVRLNRKDGMDDTVMSLKSEVTDATRQLVVVRILDKNGGASRTKASAPRSRAQGRVLCLERQLACRGGGFYLAGVSEPAG